jgi:hypothetical protein
LEDSHAKTSAKQAKVKASSKMKQEAAFSMRWYALQLKYDLAFCSWKTFQQSLGGVLTSYSGNFIKRGMMRNGSLYRLRRLERRINEKDGSVWLGTPTATMKKRSEKFRIGDGCERTPNPAEYAEEMYLTPSTIQISPKNGRYEKRKVYRESIGRHWVAGCLEEQIQTYPTPIANESTESLETIKARRERTGSGMMNLTAAVQTWPTPNCSDVFTDNLKSSQQKEGSMHSVNLSQKVMWPTANARDYKGGTQSMVGKCHLDSEVEFGSGTQQTNVPRLNPLWVEWLMGFPKGWTDLNASVTPWFPCKDEQPGKC